VVDQDGQPVTGARVSLNYRTWHAGASDVNGVVTEVSLATDQAGRFELTGVSGDRLTIENVEKSGYILSSKDKKTFTYAAGPELYSPNINSPYLVHMWKQVEHEPTISRKDFYGFQPDGRTYSIDLFTGKNIEGAQGKDDLQVRISRPQDIHPREKFVWSIELAIPNGGIVATSDEFLYQAPENGYSPSIKIEMDPKDPDWTSVLRKSFYIQTRGGAIYGAVQMTIRPVYNDKSAIGFQSILNPAGSRNLQP